MIIYFALFLGALLLLVLSRWAVRRCRGTTGWRRHGFLGIVALSVPLVLLCVAGGLYMVWYAHRSQPSPAKEMLFSGVEYLRDVRQSPRPMVIHVVRIVLDAPGIEFLVTPGKPTGARAIPGRKTTAFLEEFGCQVAINANYFYPCITESPWEYYPHPGDGVDVCGFAASRGQVYSDRDWKPGVLYLSQSNLASFDRPIGSVYNAIAGNGFLVRHGRVVGTDDEEKLYPRAGLGLSADTRTLLLFIIDGKQPGYSEGATLAELSAIMLAYGAHDAVRIDEGGSCTLAADDGHGKARLLNVPINNRIPYRERPVANHLGVFAKRLAQ